MIVANDVSISGLGFDSDNNAVSVFTATDQVDLGPCAKQQIAYELVALIAPRLNARVGDSQNQNQNQHGAHQKPQSNAEWKPS